MIFGDALYGLGMSVIGAVGNMLRLRKQVIFCLHSVADRDAPWSSRMSMSASFLDQILTDLRHDGIDVLSLRAGLDRLASGDQRPFACFTFDDGYRDNYTHAFPVFLRHKAPFAIFLTTGLIDRIIPMWWHVLERLVQDNEAVRFGGEIFQTRSNGEKAVIYSLLDGKFRSLNPDELRDAVDDLLANNRHETDQSEAYDFALEWEMIERMQVSGLATFGSHTVTHRLLSLQNERQVRAEIEGSRQRIGEKIGSTPDYFAYPFGQPHEVGLIAPTVVREAGFAAGFSTVSRPLAAADVDNRFELPRIMLARKCSNIASVKAYMSGIPANARAALRAAQKSSIRSG